MSARIYDALAASLGSDRVLMDVGTEPGVDFVDRIERSIGAAEVVLVVIGPNWISDDPDDSVNLEVAAALDGDRRVIPVLVDGARMPSPSELPAAAERH